MRSKNPELMRKIESIVNTVFFVEHRMPSVQEIAEQAGIAKSSAHRYLVDMDRRGMLSYSAGEILTEKIQEHFNFCKAPLMGGISCGQPVEEKEQIQEYLSLPCSIFGNDELFVLKASGDSMINAGISSGDYAVIRKQNTAKVGDIVVALVDHHDNTLKRLMYDPDLDRHYLHPENENYEDLYFNEIEIQGVLTSVIKQGPF